VNAAAVGFVLAIAGAIAVAHYSADTHHKELKTPAGARA
jgi:hypothetical protein